MIPRSDFWQGRRVLVTGHTGFKGTWLTLWLELLGAKVTGYALAPVGTPNMFSLVHPERSGDPAQDVRDLPALQHAIEAAQPEVIFHLAAQALVRRSYQDPVETYATNVMGTVHLLGAARASRALRSIVVVTSDKCYENREWPWGYREIDPVGGYDPYSNSKGCAELVVSAWRNSFFNNARYAEHGVALASARAGNVIGGGDWSEDRLVPDLLRAFAKARPARIRNRNAIRPWQHVLEPVRGYLMLAERLAVEGTPWAEAWNFGPADTDAQPVSVVADVLAAQWGTGARWIDDGGEHPHEASWLKLDCSKARQQLGWTPRWNLERALAAVAAWHGAYGRGEDMREVSLRQIAGYAETEH